MKNLFNEEEIEWEREWRGMPEFVQENLKSFRKIVVHFKCQEDVDDFAKLINQKIGLKQPSIGFPERQIRKCSDKRYIDEP